MTQSLNKRFLVSIVASVLFLILGALFYYAQITKNFVLIDNALPFILPLLILLYLVSCNKRNFYFLMFAILYSLSQFSYSWIGLNKELVYFVKSSFSILAYVFLIIDVFERLRQQYGLTQILTKYKFHIIALLVLNVFLFNMLLSHFHLYYEKLEIMISSMLYSSVTLILLSLGTINLASNYNRKTLLFFLATLSVVLADIIQITYYSNKSPSIFIIYPLFQILPFYLFYKQAVIDSNIVK